MKLEIENTGVWCLNASIWAFKRRHLVFMKSTPGPNMLQKTKIEQQIAQKYENKLKLCKNIYSDGPRLVRVG